MRLLSFACLILALSAATAVAGSFDDSGAGGGAPPIAPPALGAALGGSDSQPSGTAATGSAAPRAREAVASASAIANTLYFTPQDENTNTTLLFLYNTTASPDTALLDTYYLNGSVTISTAIGVPANGLVRICTDNVSTVSSSFTGATLVNFTTFSAYARLRLPAGLRASAYVAWDTTGIFDPLQSVEVMPLRMRRPATTASTVYFTPQDENTSTTLLNFFNTSNVDTSVVLQTFSLTGAATVNTTIPLPAHHLVRVCADPVSPISASFSGATLVNFTTFSAYGKLTVPAGVLYDGYVAWNTSGQFDPLVMTQTMALEFSSDGECPAVTPTSPNVPPGVLRTWPNPSTRGSKISFVLPEATDAELTVYDATGRIVKRIARGRLSAGPHDYTWDGYTQDGQLARAGVYFVQLDTPNRKFDGRLVTVP